MRKKIILFLIFILLVNYTHAEYDISAANQAYKNQDYKEAEGIYKRLLDRGVNNFELFYNLGNTYFKLGEKAKARLYYEKALRFNPLNNDLKQNLKLLKSTLKDKELIDQAFLQKILKNIIFFFPLNVLGFLSLLFFMIIMLLISALIIYKSRARRKIVKILLSIFSLLFILFILLTVFRLVQFHDHSAAVIMDDTVFAYSGPSQEFQQVFTIHAGLKVKVEKQSDDWSLIKLSSGLGGWIKTESLQKI